MTSDSEFAQKLKTLMDELKSDERVNQIFFKGVNVKGSAEIGDVEQTTTRGGSVTQEAVTGVEVGIVGEPGAGKTTLLTKIADWIDKNEKGSNSHFGDRALELAMVKEK